MNLFTMHKGLGETRIDYLEGYEKQTMTGFELLSPPVLSISLDRLADGQYQATAHLTDGTVYTISPHPEETLRLLKELVQARRN